MKGEILILIIILNFNLLSAASITGWDILTAGKTGQGELSVGGEQAGFTGIPQSTVNVPSGGSGGDGSSGGGGGSDYSFFNIDKNFFLLEVKKGIEYQERIIIVNTANSSFYINVSLEINGSFIFLSENNFNLNGGETREIILNIYFPENADNGVYLGKVYFDALGTRKTVNFVLDVKNRAPLFDIKTTIFDKYIFPGGKVNADVFVLNLGDLKNIDVELEYFISDLNNKTYASKKEMFAINDSSDKEIFIETPRNIEDGDYFFFSKVSYGNISANSYDTFFIRSIAYLIWFVTIFVNLFLIFLIAGIIVYLFKLRDQQTSPQYVSSYG